MAWLGGCCNMRNPPQDKMATPGLKRGLSGQTIPIQDVGRFPTKSPASKVVGIGIIFDAGESGCGPTGTGLAVNGLAPHGPAARSGKIHLGDVLCTVDGMDVKGIAAADMSGLILGPPGSKVSLAFERASGGGSHVYEVVLEREAPRNT